MTPVDYVVIVFFLLFMLAMGPVYKRFNQTASDYFRGGGGMLWWMVGSSAWMVTFSAWMFTGGAGKMYETGTFFLLLPAANLVATAFMYIFTAAKYRQMRVVTSVEAARDRFGRASEQWFTWLPVPVNILRGGVGLYAIAIFMSVVFRVEMSTVIVVLGVIVTLMSVFGGSAAVVASDFVQMLTIATITLVAAMLALTHPSVGGLGGLLEKLPAQHFDWTVFDRPGVIAIFALMLVLNQTVQMNSLMEGAARFLFVKTGRDAKRALLVSFWGTLLSTPIFMIPAVAATLVFPDLRSAYPTLNNPSEAAYVAMAIETLPTGMLGLLVCAIFAATMSTMDSALNRAAGIFVRNFWIVGVAPRASETQQINVGKVATLVFGLLQILAGLAFISYQDLPLFDLILLIAAVFGLPMAVPLFLGLFIRSTPGWSGWSTMLLGMAAGIPLQRSGMLGADNLNRWFSPAVPFSAQEAGDLRVAITTGLVLTVCVTWFFVSLLFARGRSPAEVARVDGFFERMQKPVDPEAEGVPGWVSDRRHYRVMGLLCLCYGGFILLLALLPNPFWGRLCFVFCGGVIAGLGAWLFCRSRR